MPFEIFCDNLRRNQTAAKFVFFVGFPPATSPIESVAEHIHTYVYVYIIAYMSAYIRAAVCVMYNVWEDL